jgi:mRNA-degrading endonuclease RelE of RelBE toxin-antitoxin system
LTYKIKFSRTAQRVLTEQLPEKVATACLEFVRGPLAENPHRVGKQLRPPAAPHYAARRGQFRVIYDIYDDLVLIEVVTIQHRRDVYRGLS